VSSSSLVRHLTECGAEKVGKKLSEEGEVEAVLKRLDRLTQDEARTATAQTLDVVYRLMQNMGVIMEREQNLTRFPTHTLLTDCLIRL
jgi:phosphoribosyl-ATP pyrophosphohydrolase